MLVWLLFGQLLIILAVFITDKICPEAKGSGIPHMKSIMAGADLPKLLTFRALIAKMLGVTAALGAGLSVGKEGPWVHFSAILANQLSKVEWFGKVIQTPKARLNILSAGFAAGTAANFGAPIGGVLFSIEVTATHYLVPNYVKAFFCAICAALYFRFITSIQEDSEQDTALFNTDFTDFSSASAELFLYVVLGVLCGVGGSIFVKLNARVLLWKERNSGHWVMRQLYIFPCLVMFVTSLLTFPVFVGDFLALSPRHAVNDLFSTGELDHKSSDATNGDWVSINIFASLTLLCGIKFALTCVSITLPVPCGLYTPVFCIGAAFGRLYGELMRIIFGTSILPGGYALVGAASLCGGVTRTISSAVFVFELTGQLNHIMPVMCGVIVAVGMGNFLSPSIYDSILEINKLPYYYSNPEDPEFMARAEDVMRSQFLFLEQGASYAQIAELLEQRKQLGRKLLDEVPIVVDKENMMLLGAIKVRHLEELMEEVLTTPNPEDLDTAMQNEAGLSWRDDISQSVRGPLTMLANTPVYKLTAHFLSLIHISEPTRLLSISYAVFCLKKKNNTRSISNIVFTSHTSYPPSYRLVSSKT
eukprot:TRINITY_DN43598_c0_g1_i1.p1 TRINITY_DN43598_c0_g1~~TRINITY_DN43598_c0_g1_i1.p1  ORF type:complete len:589 (-),score=102.29 TRINITY_DN43598_c0_g1_i1:21-1787(-)